MRTDQFDYHLPEELIAAVPAERRDASRLLVLDRASGSFEHRLFGQLPEFLRSGDVMVVNDARVVAARVCARRASGGRVPLLLVRPLGDGRWEALLEGRGRLKPGEVLELEDLAGSLTLIERREGGQWTVEVRGPEQVWDAGRMPLPPYILKARRRRGLPEEMPQLDRERYQTVYATKPGAVAAPTAGLHFTEALLQRVRQAGVEIRPLTLYVGPGTFRPVKSEHVEQHRMDAEYFELPAETAQAVGRALAEGRRVVAVGTTVCRVLEHVARTGRWAEQSGWTDLFIYPPFEFKAVGALVTNFHLPRSTLLMLVSAFAGRDLVLRAYREAVRRRYRFYSYGDAMLIV